MHTSQFFEIPHEICGKVIVATDPVELPGMERLYQRCLANDLKVVKLSPNGVKEIEPHVQSLDGILVPSTGIVDFGRVCRKLAELIQALKSDGRLVDDFLILNEGAIMHVCNAPSPAATSSLEIGRYVADQLFAKT